MLNKLNESRIEMKTSEEWQEIVKDYIVVLDPDGWDRSPEGFDFSWFQEQITYEKFMNRVVISTCEFNWNNCRSIEEIFKILEDRVKPLENQKEER